MRKPILKSVFAVLTVALVLTGCGPALNLSKTQALDKDISSLPEKQGSLDEDQRKDWPMMDMYTDTVPGMSVRKAYEEIIKDNEGKPVVVAVLDAGVDIHHEDLEDVIWTNEKEIPDNGIDDDNNGYVDDVHGWNFLGDMVHGTLNYTRILRELKPKYEGKSASDIAPENKDEFALYQRANKEYEKEYSETKQRKTRFEMLKAKLGEAFEALTKKMGQSDFSKDELSKLDTDDAELSQAKFAFMSIMQQANAANGKEVMDQLNDAYDHFNDKLKYHLNIDYVGRKKTGDDPDDFADRDYGDNRVDGPTKDKEDIMHGTHVAGIIAAERNNDIGMNGVANNVKIMGIRAVPDGDEFDKDIALGIRYAVDNGAKIINMSFGKDYSSHPDWVIDAIKYAAKHDVLLVNAAGNDSYNLDTIRSYPNDQWPGHENEITDNIISVGALNYTYDKNLVAPFSNYGKTNVDVYAPGVQIWSTTPLDNYKFLQGTSMAAPEVAGVAALIRSYFPKLTASQVKKAIMESGLTTTKKVMVPKTRGVNAEQEEKPFNELSKSGKIVNLYNALIYASKM